MKKIISLLMPTRGRPAWAERFFKSVADFTTHLDQVEIIIYVDDDDIVSHYLASNTVRVDRIIGPKMSMGRYNSTCLNRSRGDIIVLANDDMVIRTPGWDEKIRELDCGIPDGVYLAYANDLFKGEKLCTFPILSRRTCETLVDPFPAPYQGAFIDQHIFDIFQRLRRAGYDRIKYLEDVVFEHMHFRAGKAERDTTYAQRDRFGDDPVFINLVGDRAASVMRLISAIEGRVLEAESSELSSSSSMAKKVSFERVTRLFLMDGDLPFGYRFHLWLWLMARHAASRSWLKPFIR